MSQGATEPRKRLSRQKELGGEGGERTGWAGESGEWAGGLAEALLQRALREMSCPALGAGHSVP